MWDKFENNKKVNTFCMLSSLYSSIHLTHHQPALVQSAVIIWYQEVSLKVKQQLG